MIILFFIYGRNVRVIPTREEYNMDPRYTVPHTETFPESEIFILPKIQGCGKWSDNFLVSYLIGLLKSFYIFDTFTDSPDIFPPGIRVHYLVFWTEWTPDVVAELDEKILGTHDYNGL